MERRSNRLIGIALMALLPTLVGGEALHPCAHHLAHSGGGPGAGDTQVVEGHHDRTAAPSSHGTGEHGTGESPCTCAGAYAEQPANQTVSCVRPAWEVPRPHQSPIASNRVPVRSGRTPFLIPFSNPPPRGA
jgi:hypothetical protein